MRNINARNLGAALAYLGADVESALLELTVTSPQLDAKVRRALFHTAEPAKLRSIKDRSSPGLHFVLIEHPRWSCVMHAIDFVTQVIDDASIISYLVTKFSEYSDGLQKLQEAT